MRIPSGFRALLFGEPQGFVNDVDPRSCEIVVPTALDLCDERHGEGRKLILGNGRVQPGLPEVREIDARAEAFQQGLGNCQAGRVPANSTPLSLDLSISVLPFSVICVPVGSCWSSATLPLMLRVSDVVTAERD